MFLGGVLTSLSKAKSLECGEILTPELAESYYQMGLIFDKRKFVCIGKGCSSRITCANMDNPKRKLDPYFRTVEEHSKSCDIYETKYKNTVDLGDFSHVPSEQSKDPNRPDEFILVRPKSHFFEERALPNIEGVETVTVIKGKQTGQIDHYSPSSLYHLGSLVAKYNKFERVNLHKKRTVAIGENKYLYSALFKRLKKQHFDSYEIVSQRRRVYWGHISSVDLQSNGDVRFTLTDVSRFKTAPATVSVFIKKFILDNYQYKRPIRDAIIDSIGTIQDDLYIYVYGIPSLEVKDRVFLNFRPSNLDLVEIQKHNKAFKRDSQRLAFSV